MKRLFLTSFGLSALPKFLGKSPKGLKLVFIPTASNLYKHPWWIDQDREKLKGMGFEFKEVDLKGKSKKELEIICEDVDVIYIAGGNTFYLLEQVQQSGFDEIIKVKINNIVYVGASAGACLAGPDIEPLGLNDDPKEAPNLKSTKGLNLVDFIVIPHFDVERWQEENRQIMKKYSKKFKLLPLNNDQAVVVEGDNYKIVKSG